MGQGPRHHPPQLLAFHTRHHPGESGHQADEDWPGRTEARGGRHLPRGRRGESATSASTLAGVGPGLRVTRVLGCGPPTKTTPLALPPSSQSPTGGGQRPPTLSQAPEQLRPDHSLDGHHAYKPVLTALTNVCLESFFFFFFFQTEKGSLPESANSKMCLWDLPLPPQGESHRCGLVLGEAGAQTQVPHQALQMAPSNPPPQGPGHRAGHQQPSPISPTGHRTMGWGVA